MCGADAAVHTNISLQFLDGVVQLAAHSFVLAMSLLQLGHLRLKHLNASQTLSAQLLRRLQSADRK